jgi:hypothetical protein
MSHLPAWLAQLQNIRPRFEAGAEAHRGVELMLWGPGNEGRARTTQLCLIKFHGVGAATRVHLGKVPACREKGTAIVYGVKESVPHFIALADEAGAYLPPDEYPGLQPDHFHTAWLDFVLTNLRACPGRLLLGADPEPVEGKQTVCDQLAVNVYQASVAAIDRAVHAPGLPPDASRPGLADTNRQGKAAAVNSLERRNGVWVIAFSGKGDRYVPAKMRGWPILAKLLGPPNKVISALELEGHPAEVIPRSQSDAATLDAEAERGYRARIREIEAELPEVRRRAEAGDAEAEARVLQLEGELESIGAELSRHAPPRPPPAAAGRQRSREGGRQGEVEAQGPQTRHAQRLGPVRPRRPP